ncbi:DNA polymerase eta isoform X1 [Ananas comosus]|uniref:DNA polymerase eta n=1 Tax=Ananas comosus TaxID=4615 RepID=A0A6P5FTQ7_ANACO|nr:DNA polymerase eta isoform X1 [Ananas comosus]
MPVARPEPQEPRVIAHVDMDCFYVQVEQRKNPELRGLPTAVVQYNNWKGGGLIAVSYEARKFGVKRSMRGDEAKKVCPDIQLVQVPVARGKADLNSYRSAGSEVVAILSTKGRCERASIDEVYLDLTDAAKSMLSETPPEVLESIPEEALKSKVLGLNSEDDDREKNVREWLFRRHADYQDKLLACGAIIVARLRVKVLEETKFTCSAGIAHNKMLAKLASAMHKPAQQTVVPSSSVMDLLSSLPVKKMIIRKQLGGKLGCSLQIDLGVNTIGDLLNFSEAKLQECYGINTGTWLWKIARGTSGEEVEDRLLPKSHGCGKTFPGPKALKTTASVRSWLNQLCEELSERIQFDLDQNKRVAHTLTLHTNAYKENGVDSQRKFPSKSCPLRYGTAKIQDDAMKLFDSALHDFLSSQNIRWGITSLSISASKISEIPSGTCSILKFFRGENSSSMSSDNSDVLIPESISKSPKNENEGCMAATQSDNVDQPACQEKENENHSNQTVQDKANPAQGIGASQKKLKEKEPYSILKFFPGSESSSTRKRAFGDLNQDHLERNQTEQQEGPSEGCDDATARSNQTAQQHEIWNFNVEDVDPSVIDELPLEIQREVRGWLHSATKRTNMTKRGSSIAHYFSPVKKT